MPGPGPQRPHVKALAGGEGVVEGRVGLPAGDLRRGRLRAVPEHVGALPRHRLEVDGLQAPVDKHKIARRLPAPRRRGGGPSAPHPLLPALRSRSMIKDVAGGEGQGWGWRRPVGDVHEHPQEALKDAHDRKPFCLQLPRAPKCKTLCATHMLCVCQSLLLGMPSFVAHALLCETAQSANFFLKANRVGTASKETCFHKHGRKLMSAD